MTQDQRYDMITEMYEATRYAKEMHKNAKQAEKRMNAYNTITMQDNASSPRMSRKIRDKTKRAQDIYTQYLVRDTIGIGKNKEITTSDKKDIGHKFADNQPGRYKKHEERKPGTYLNAQRELNQ